MSGRGGKWESDEVWCAYGLVTGRYIMAYFLGIDSASMQLGRSF